MRKRGNRFLALLLAFTMCFSTFSVPVFAAETETVTMDEQTTGTDAAKKTTETAAAGTETAQTEIEVETTKAADEETETKATEAETNASVTETESKAAESVEVTETNAAETKETEAETAESESETAQTETEEETEPLEDAIAAFSLETNLSKNDTIEGTPYHVTSLKEYAVAPNVKERVIITNNEGGTSQTVANVMEIDTSAGDAKVVAGYGKLDPAEEGWTLSRMTDQSHLYESAYGENVVGGINASLFNITTGEPMGVLVMKGKTYKEDMGQAYVAVFSDGSVGIFYGGTTLAQAAAQQSEKQGYEVTLLEAIAGWVVLVDDGKITSEGSNPGYYARTAIGIKEDGTVVMLQADGTQAPRSTGYTLEEMGYMMQSLGCVMALELDEGGSSTFISQREGEDDLSLRNTPAGGAERYISTTILVVSTAKASGDFDHASIEPNSEYYTPNSSVELEATGIDSSGALADAIPEDVTWAFASGSENMGTLEDAAVSGNNAAVVFKSNGTVGDAVINMLNGTEVVGTATVHIQDPDELVFSSSEVNLKYSEVTDLGLKALYQGAPVNIKAGDITWSVSDETAGTFDGIYFVVTGDKQVSVTAQVTASYGDISAETTINVGKQPTVILDGGDTDIWNYSDIETTVTSFAGLASDQVAAYFYNRGAVVKGSVVQDSDEEYADIVRFGSKAIKLEYDWTNTTGTDGVCLGLGSAIDIPGTPTAIGIWVYVPENVPVPWLRAQIATSTDGGTTYTNAYVDFTTQADTGEETVAGWQYLEADLSAYAGTLIRVNSGMLFRAMMTQAGIGWYTTDGVKLDKSALKGYIIIDNIQIVYGANNQDVTNPRVNNIQLINDNGTKTELKDGAVLESNSLNFFVSYDDNEDTDEFATGIESAYFYFDGNYYGEGTIDNLGSTLTGLELANGEHSLTFYLKDGFGNVTRETRYFTVEDSDSYTNVSLNLGDAPKVGKDYVLTLESNNGKNISKAEASIVIPSGYPIKSVEFSTGFTGSYEYNEVKNTLKIAAEADGSQTGDTIAAITVEIPAATTKGTSINLEVNKGAYEVVDESCAVNAASWAKGFSTSKKSIAIEAGYLVEADILIVGRSGVITVTKDDKAQADIDVYLEDGTKLGTTDSNGQLETSDLTAAAGNYSVYAMDSEGNRSYLVTFMCYDATGEEDGAPYNISVNIPEDLADGKNISWMSHPIKSTDEAQILVSLKEDMADAKTIKGESAIVTYSGSKLANKVNSVDVTGLEPETTYYYKVGDGNVWSEVRSFTTKAADDEETNFFILADIQEEDALTGFTRIAEHLKADGYDFGIQTGDAVDNVRYYDQWEDAIGLFSLISDYDMIHVVGNHEDDDDNNDAYAAKNIFNLQGDWYSFEYGDVYVAVLNHVTDEAGLNEFSKWLAEDAAKSECTWKIATGHVPVYTTNPGGTNKLYMSIVSKAMEEAGIDFYFAGDAHSYARTAPMTDLKVDEENGVVYYISGTTGGKSYSAVDNPDYNFEIATIDFESVYLAVNADFDSIEVTAYNVDSSGNKTVLDTYKKEVPYCQNDEHTFTYDKKTDTLTCSECPTVTTAAGEMYSGFAADSETGKNMYFIAGKYTTGYIQLEKDAYFFDEDGLGYEGEFVMADETCCFKGGKFASSENEDVIAAGWCGENACFVLYKDGTIVIDGTGALNTSSREDVPWQNYRAFIEKVVFGKGITYISDYAFYDCDALTTIEFEDGSKMNTIGGAAFFSCGVLKEVTLPEGVEIIYGNAFAKCNVLASVYMPDSISYISSAAFTGSSKVVLSVAAESYAKEYAVKNSIDYVERKPVKVAEGTCGNDLTWILMSDGVLTISGTGAMNNYSSIAAVPWNDYRSEIKTVEIAAGVTSLGDYAFANCRNLTAVNFAAESQLEVIGGSVFYGCVSLTEITLPEGLTTIYGNTFAYCQKLTSVYLPDTLSYMSSNVFKHAEDNVVLSVAADSYAKDYAEAKELKYTERKITEVASGTCGTNLTWTLTSDGLLKIEGSGKMTAFASAAKVPWNEYVGIIKTVNVAAGVTNLSDYAFNGCTNLTKITFEEDSKLEVIGGSVFYGCTSLESITLPKGVTTIYGNAFAKCTKLTSVYLPDSISYMSSSAFKNCTKVVLSVGYDSYAKEYAEKNSIQYTERKITVIDSGNCGKNAQWKLYSDGKLDITGTGAMNTVSSADAVPWHAYRSVIKVVNIASGITTICDYAFYKCEKLEEVNFAAPGKVTVIGGSAFYKCNSLVSVVLPDSVTTIYGNAFAKCQNLTSVKVPSTVKYISSSAFSGSEKVEIIK